MPYRRSQDHQLFRFEVFVTAKQLGDALAMLTGKAVQVGTPQLVTNAKNSGGRLTARTGGTLLEMFAEHLRKTKPKDLMVGDVKAWMEQSGAGNPSSSSYLIVHATKARLLKKVGKAKGPGNPQHYTLGSAITAAPKEKADGGA